MLKLFLKQPLSAQAAVVPWGIPSLLVRVFQVMGLRPCFCFERSRCFTKQNHRMTHRHGLFLACIHICLFLKNGHLKHRMWMSLFFETHVIFEAVDVERRYEIWRIKGWKDMYVWDSIWAMSSYTVQLPKEFSCEKFAALCALCYRHSHDDGCVGDILCSDIRNRRLELKFTDCPCENSKSERFQVCQLCVEMLHF